MYETNNTFINRYYNIFVYVYIHFMYAAPITVFVLIRCIQIYIAVTLPRESFILTEHIRELFLFTDLKITRIHF